MTSLRLPVLRDFSGKHEDWDSWSKKLKAYFFTVNPLYDKLFKAAESATDPISDESFTDGHEEDFKLSQELHAVLVQLCSGSAEVLLNQYDTNHGAEDWRQLQNTTSAHP